VREKVMNHLKSFLCIYEMIHLSNYCLRLVHFKWHLTSFFHSSLMDLIESGSKLNSTNTIHVLPKIKQHFITMSFRIWTYYLIQSNSLMPPIFWWLHFMCSTCYLSLRAWQHKLIREPILWTCNVTTIF
jgi:hypothetical protein